MMQSNSPSKSIYVNIYPRCVADFLVMDGIGEKSNMIENPVQADKSEKKEGSHLLEFLTRKEAEKSIVSLIHKGRWSKADLFLINVKEQNFVLKDFSKKSLFIRLLGRLQIWRECRAYQAIQGIPGIPEFYKKVSPWSFVMEYVEGIRLVDYRGDIPSRTLLERLKALVSAIHQSGVFHNDIRGRDNVIVDKGGRLMILDFAGAVYFKPGGILYKMLSPIFRWVDHSAYLKWKSEMTPEEMQEEEKRILQRFNFLRRFWIFNLKGPKK